MSNETWQCVDLDLGLPLPHFFPRPSVDPVYAPLVTSSIHVRPAQVADIPHAARLAALLVRQHHEFDPLRFFLPDDPEAGYRWWFGKELDRPEVVLLVAVKDSSLVGYCYARLEERDWNQLLDACGAIHDVWVEASSRRAGIAKQLVQATMSALAAKGAPRVVLHTAAQNVAAQKLFASLGFRSTMIEMTCECTTVSVS